MWADLRRNLPMFIDPDYARLLAKLARVDATAKIAEIIANYSPGNGWVETQAFLRWLDEETKSQD